MSLLHDDAYIEDIIRRYHEIQEGIGCKWEGATDEQELERDAVDAKNAARIVCTVIQVEALAEIRDALLDLGFGRASHPGPGGLEGLSMAIAGVELRAPLAETLSNAVSYLDSSFDAISSSLSEISASLDALDKLKD